MDIKNETQKETQNNRRQDYRKYLSQSATRETMQKDHQRNCTIFLGMFLLATGISFVFNQIASDPSLNIAMVYVLGLFMVARYTDGYLFGLLFAICSVISVNYFFTVPYRNLNFTMEGYQVTFAGMLIIAMMAVGMTFTTMYVAFTPVGEGSIAGVQGRYLLPVMPLLCMLCSPEGVQNRMNKVGWHTVFFLLNGVILATICVRNLASFGM